jgi:hypothetical protein
MRGAPGGFADDPCGAVPVQPLSVCSQEGRPFQPLTDGQVDRPGGAWCERDGHYLAALAGDHEGPVPALSTQRLDVRARGFGHPQPVKTSARRR